MDIDECAAKSDNCTRGPSTYCSNTVGSYLCLCNPGYIQMGGNCVDIDECKMGTHNCSLNANCTNTIGNYSCSCNYGYIGDGHTCSKFIVST